MKYFFAALASLVMLVGVYIRMQWDWTGLMKWESTNWSEEEKRNRYKRGLILWVLATIALFILTFAGVAFRGL
jgi:hypothetical protein